MAFGALVRRPLPEFGMELAWYGKDRIVVERNGEEVYNIRLKDAGCRTALLAMKREHAAMHAACQAFG